MILRSRLASLFAFSALGLAFAPLAQAAEDTTPIVAVFLMESKSSPLSADEVVALTDYLSTRLGEQGGFHIIPRDDLKKLINSKKIDSHAANYDATAQIEMGRELAAQFSISSAILKVGTKCLIIASVWDLKKGVQIKSATEKEICNSDKLVDKVDVIADRLTAAMKGQPYVTKKEEEPATDTQAVPDKNMAMVEQPATGKASSKYLSLPSNVFSPSDTIPLQWHADVQKRDWVSVAMQGMPDNTFISYMNTGTEKNGTYTMANLDPGEYEARIYLDYSKVGYQVADRLPFRVGATVAKVQASIGGLQSTYLKVNKGMFGSSEEVEVFWFNTPGNSGDWVTVVPKGSPDTQVGSYDYTKKKDGSFKVTGLAPGEYEARFFLDYRKVGYKVGDRLAFTVR